MVAQQAKDQLKRLKKNVERSFVAFKQNNDRFHNFYKFVFKTTIEEADESTLRATQKPIIEFNILQAFISRLCGEFSKQEPSIEVRADIGSEVDPQLLEVVEGHIRHIMQEAQKQNTQYQVYKDQLGGGFSNLKISTEYANSKSFDQVIKVERVYEPTLMGYDPMARNMDMSDGQYCFEIYPLEDEEFKRRYPDIDIDHLNFNSDIEGFSWAYDSEGQKVVLLADYYEKKKKRKRIVRLADGQVMTTEEYEKFLEEFKASGQIAQPPVVVEGPRWTDFEIICRYIFMGQEVIEYEETDYPGLPHIFVDGDSVVLKEAGKLQKFTKPYAYHAKGIQRLKNLAGQALGNDIEMMVMHKFMIAKESIPDEAEYQNAMKNPQIASTFVYNAYMNNDPNKPVPPPREIARVPTPPEVTNTFVTADQTAQVILGSYDAALGINDNQLSGVAIVEAATQSNATAMPYIVGHMQAWTAVANMIVKMIPKYYVTPRTIPILNREGKREYIKINQNNEKTFSYDENDLQVHVEAGVNFAIAKNKALQQIIALMNASPNFAEFMNQEGLDVLLSNVEFRGSDILENRVEKWLKKVEQMKQQAQQNDPRMMQAQMQAQMMQQQMQLEQQKLQLKGKEVEADSMIKSEQILVEKEKVDNERMDILMKAGESQAHLQAAIIKSDAEIERARADLALNHRDVTLKHGVNLHGQLMKGKEDEKKI